MPNQSPPVIKISSIIKSMADRIEASSRVLVTASNGRLSIPYQLKAIEARLENINLNLGFFLDPNGRTAGEILLEDQLRIAIRDLTDIDSTLSQLKDTRKYQHLNPPRDVGKTMETLKELGKKITKSKSLVMSIPKERFVAKAQDGTDQEKKDALKIQDLLITIPARLTEAMEFIHLYYSELFKQQKSKRKTK